jgi:hypothetical protein
MKKLITGLALVASLGAFAADEPVAKGKDAAKDLASAPEPVVKSIKKEFPDAKVKDVDKTTKDNKEAWKVSLDDAAGKSHTMYVMADGTIIKEK